MPIFPAFEQDYVERVAGDTPGGPWTERAGDVDIVAIGSRFGLTDGTPGVTDAFVNSGTDLPSSDMWIQGQVWDWSGVNSFAALGVATRVNAGAGFTGFTYNRDHDASVDRFGCRNWTSATVVASTPYDQAFAFPGIGETIRAEVIGNHHRALSNGSLVTVGGTPCHFNDATFNTAKRVGVQVYRQTSGFTTAIGQFSYGSFANAPVFSNLAANSNTTDATSFATASVTPTLGTLVLISFVHTFGSATPRDADTVTGASISGATRILSVPFNSTGTPRSKLELWAAVGTGSAGAITISFTGGPETETGCAWSVEQVTNINTNQGTNGVLQSAQSAAAAATGYVTGTLVGSLSGYRPVYGCAAGAVNTTIAAQTAHTRLADVGYATPAARLATSYFNFMDASFAFTGPSSVYATIIVELASKITWSPFLPPSLIELPVRGLIAPRQAGLR